MTFLVKFVDHLMKLVDLAVLESFEQLPLTQTTPKFQDMILSYRGSFPEIFSYLALVLAGF